MKVKKHCFCLTFSRFSFFFLFFHFFFYILAMPTNFRWLASFLRRIFLSFLRRALLWKFLGSPTQNWNVKLNFFKFRSEYFLVNVLRIACLIFFSNDLWNIGKTIKTPSFYDNTYLHISSISLTLDVTLLTEYSICRLKHVKGEHIPMKILSLK